jgi:ABC-2 type transport system permease protein
MLRGLWTLTWLEMKIFAREPLGLTGTLIIPLLFVALGRMFGRAARLEPRGVRDLVTIDLPIFAAIFIALSAVLSLVTIVSIYRESGILKRLRATPLRPHTILTAHVLSKLAFTALTLAAMAAAGRRFIPDGMHGPFLAFGLALIFSTVCIVSMGFLIASIVPTARFAQPIGTLFLYPMLGLAGLFVPVAALPPGLQVVSRFVPLTYVVSLLRGIWHGDGWLRHSSDVAALALVFLVCTAASARVFRWE